MIDKINDEFIVDCTNNSKEERQQVYKFLVDNRNYDKSYLGNDFSIIVCNKKQGNTNWLTIHGAEYTNGKSYNVYTFEQFKEMYLEEEFVLPEKWCVKVTNKTHKTISEKRHSTFYNYETYITSMLIVNKRWNSWDLNKYAIKEDYTEITFEQFLKYVLKQETMEKEIIGYKLVKYEYEAVAKKISGIEIPLDVNNIRPKSSTKPSTVMYDNLKKAGVLDLWFEPVYATSEQTVSMNGKFNLTVRNKRVFHKNEDITDYIEEIGTWWKNVMLEGNLKFAKSYDFLIPSHNIKIMKSGCQSQETYLSDWLKVYDLIK